MSHAVLNEETLEKLVYERSKNWANMIQNCMEIDDGDELDLDDFEELFEGEDIDPDVPENEEAEEDARQEEDLGMGNINTTIAMSKAELTTILCSGENKSETAELEEILNQTMPVLQEHNRKWKAAGLDQILDTFDPQKIEQHVGQWMRRNNSIYLEEENSRENSRRYDSHSDESDNESPYSSNTAHYIIQTPRRNAPNPKMSNGSTIKLYRTHPRRRADDRRGKYTYEEQEHRRHMQVLLQRRRERKRKLAYIASTSMHRSYSNRSHHSYLRKRRPDSSLFGSPSSGEDVALAGCDCKSCQRLLLTRSAYEYCPYRGRREYHHQSASSRSMLCLRHPHSFREELELRPRLMENECRCCDSDRLCTDVVHIANSSTEEWVVDNCNSPVLMETPTKCSNRLQTCREKHLRLRKAPQSGRSKCSSDCAMRETPHRVTRKATSAGASYTPGRERTRLMARNLVDSDTSDEDERMERNKPAISSVEKAPKKKEKSTRLPPISENVAKTKPKEHRHELQAIETDSSDDNELTGRSRLMSFSERKQKTVAKNKKAVKTPSKPMSAVKETPKKKTVVSGQTKNLPAIGEDEAKAKESSTLPVTLNEDEAKRVKGVTPDVNKMSQTFAKICINSQSEQPTPNSDAYSKKIVGTESSVIMSTPVASKEKRVRPKSAAKKKTNAKSASSLPQISEEATDFQCASNKGTAKKAILKPKPCTTPASTRSPYEWPPSTSTSKSNSKKLNETDEEITRALALSKETYRKEQLMRRPDQRSKVNPQSASQEQSLFHNNSVACNSTALANDTASTRVLPNKLNAKNRSAVSSSKQEPKIDEIIILDSSTESVAGEEPNKAGGEADCTVVTSTTSCETKGAKPSPLFISKRGILLHSSNTAGSETYTLTEQDLGRVIGERRAKKYLKYHIGSRSYDSRRSVYYRPTPKLASALSASPDTAHTLVHELETSSGSCCSDDDIFEHMERYGEVYSVLGNPKDD
ncbi:flocculation protein FLO11-like [Drosophila guanche]|uniref:Uncharacterized protein n=1 Tax=Drosophila guanche TaxID=7266 RepID=A0A3B0JDN0_DROGU|nr:flocculation protein FLO11-like [Drosophila guanche]SPP80494.1 Hypothetical predicted protein [Drosophila guanche]